MMRTFPSLLKILAAITLILACSEIASAQTLSKSDASLFKKAEKQYITGKFDDAAQNYTQIITASEHGKSLKRLGDIEALVRGNSPEALKYYTRALVALKADLVNAQSAGYLESISDIEEWLGACEKGISTNGGENVQVEEQGSQSYSDSVYAQKPGSGESGYQSQSQDPYQNPVESQVQPEKGVITASVIRVDPDGMFLSDMNMKVSFYKNAIITSYFAYTEKPLPKYSLPSSDKLKAILTEILQNSEKYTILAGLEWGDRESIVFITNETFFDDNNDHKCKAFSITKESQKPEETSIDLGDMASVILIKTK